MSDARSSNQLATMPSIDTATGIRKLLRRAAQWDEAVLPLVRRLFARDEGRTLVAAYGDSYAQTRRSHEETGVPREVAEYRESRRDRALKRLLAASRALASVRRLGVPALQINVARRQVNVAGLAA